MGAGRWAAIVAGAVTLLPLSAVAEDPTTEPAIEWHAPSECPDEAAVRGHVQRLLGGSIPRTTLSVRAEISSAPNGYALELETTADAHHGVKHLEDASCDALTRAASVLIALAINPDLVLSDGDASAGTSPAQQAALPTPPASQAPPEELPPPLAPSSAPTPRTSAPRPSAFEGHLGLAALGEAGTVPGFSPGLLLSLGASYGWLLFGAAGEVVTPQRTTVSDRPGLGALVGYTGGRAFGCVGPFSRRVTPAACAGLGIGRLSAESRGAPIPGNGSLLWITPELGGLVRYELDRRFSLEGGVTLRLAVLDSAFTLDNVGPAYSPGRVAVAAQVGAATRLW